MSHAPMVSQRPRPPPRTRPCTCSPKFGLNATIVACPLGARSSVAEQSAHNRSVVGSIPAGPTLSCTSMIWDGLALRVDL